MKRYPYLSQPIMNYIIHSVKTFRCHNNAKDKIYTCACKIGENIFLAIQYLLLHLDAFTLFTYSFPLRGSY